MKQPLCPARPARSGLAPRPLGPLAFCAALLAGPGHAQPADPTLLSLEQLLNATVVGASKYEQKQSQTEIDGLQGKLVGGRAIEVHRKAVGESLDQCQAVFVATSAVDGSARVLERLRERPVLTVADSPGAMRRGVVLNMAVAFNKVTFEANQQAARSAGLTLSSKLLNLATRVQR